MTHEKCKYCGGNCPNEPADSEHLCDGFAGDIDNLYEEHEPNPWQELYAKNPDAFDDDHSMDH